MNGYEGALVAVVAVLAVAVSFLILLWDLRRSRAILDKWAANEGFNIVSAERRWVLTGPFWWRTGRGQRVFYVTVRDAKGHVRRAYVRVGGWLLGLFSDVADVEWQD